MNHGNSISFVKSYSGASYIWRLPKMPREMIDATTEATTSGANIVMEKFPSTTCAANTAPAIGALQPAANPAAAPHATSKRSRYGGHFTHCPSFDATDRKSTRLNSSHSQISYAVFCLKKKK